MSEFLWLDPFCPPVDSEPILRDVFDGWDSGDGIFSYLSSQAALPWAEDETVTSAVLDLSYFGNHSGGKFCAPLVKLMLTDGVVPSAGRTMLAKVIATKYLRNWTVLWDTNVLEYNPIHNYDMVEERDLTTTEDEETVTDGTLARTGTDSTEYGRTDTTTHGMTNTTTDYAYGLNTVNNNPKPSDKSVSEDGGTTEVESGGDDTRRLNLQDKNDVTETVDNDGTEHEEIHRSGNIGVTTTQQMIQSERELRKWNFFDNVFKDLDRELALMYFDPCRV